MMDINNVGALTEEGEKLNAVTYPNDRSLTSRLMNTKIIRIHPGTKYDCLSGKNILVFNISTLSRRDDSDPKNENETPLFYAEEKHECSCCCSCSSTSLNKFEIFDSNTKELFSVCEIREKEEKVSPCCGEVYIIYPNIYNYKAKNQNDQSIIKRFDSRSFYRTYDNLGATYYKIGKPYIEKETSCSDCCANCCYSLPCCCCSPHDEAQASKDSCCCCCCCCSKKPAVIDDKRTYIDIFNMSDQSVGKFAEYFDEKGCCCVDTTLFYEIYFPPDSNEMTRLALIGQIIFFIKHGITGCFGILPGSRDNIERYN